MVQTVILGIVHVFTTRTGTEFSLEKYLNTLTTDGLALSVSIIVSAVAGLVLVFAFIKARKGLTFAQYLSLKPISLKTVLMSIGIPIALTIVIGVLSSYFLPPQQDDFMTEAYKNSIYPALFWIAVVVFGPAFEEIFFRGFVFIGLKESRIGAAGAVILTSLAWAVLHIQYEWTGIVSIFVLGIVMGVVRLKTGSLWSTLIMHMTWNLLATVAIVLSINGIGN
jgi:uncharacterized protein